MLKKAAVFAIILLILLPVQGIFALDGTQRAELKNARLVNSFGEAMSQNVNTHQQIQVSADVTNKQDKPQTFVYIVQIVNQNNVSQKLTWISAALNPQQTLSPAISWSTEKPGTYTAEIYVWDSIKDASALTPSLEFKITVS
ncbi:MAG: hypothetical protein ACREAX_04070 [Candidatus Nitrosotenuis sp.]